jgi:hypothetical protein
MANKIPLKATYSGSNTSGLAELQSGDTIAVSYIDGLQTSLDAKQLAAGDYNVGDNVKILLGASDDLQIYHDGSNSIIKDAGTGNIHILANDFKVMNAAGDENVIAAYQDGTVRLSHNNVTRFETTTSGIDVTGTTVTDQLTVQGGITEQETTKTASFTPNLSTDGTIFDCSGTMTITMPSATAGKSFTIIDSGSGTVSWGGTIKWSGGAAPTPSGITIVSFISNGTDWYGMQAGTGFA